MPKRPYTQHPELIDTKESLRILVETLKKQPAFYDGKPAFSIDTEFIREKTFYPIVALIQVGTRTESWLIDPLKLSAEDLKPFLDLVADPGYLKILHAAQADQECLYTSYGVIATPSFDTAAGGSLCGFGEAPGLAKLVKEICDISLEKSHARTDWTVRPLPLKLALYAHQDVRYLFILTEWLLKKLEGMKRLSMAFTLSAKYENARLFAPTAEDIAAKITKNKKIDGRTYVTLVELIKWREGRVQDLDIPRKWVADDDLLMAVASSRPKDLDHLSAFRGLNKGELKYSGEAILEAVRRAREIPEASLPKMKRPDQVDDHEIRATEALAFFMRVMSDKYEIASKILGSSEVCLQLVRGNFKTKDELLKQGVLPETTIDLIGAELIGFLNGEISIRLKGTDVEIG